MADTHIGVPTHPVAPRLTQGLKIPHIGPHIEAYRAAHAQTVGHESDEWWAKVRLSFLMSLLSDWLIMIFRWRVRCSTGIGPSRLSDQVVSPLVTLRGSLKALLTHPTIVLTVGRSNTQIRRVAP